MRWGEDLVSCGPSCGEVLAACPVLEARLEPSSSPSRPTTGTDGRAPEAAAPHGDHESQPGRLLLPNATPPWVRDALRVMGHRLVFDDRT